MHPEDIKAAIRKQFGTLTAFELANGLPAKSVNDVLRGRKSVRVRKAIDNVVQIEARASRQVVDKYTSKTRHGKSA